MKVVCIIQGNVRNGTELILEEMCSKFDYVIFSTWKEEVFNFKSNNLITIFNDKPSNYGLSNRNLLRYSTSIALKICEDLKCDFVCKIRSDMLFLNISKYLLFKLLGKNNFDKILTFNFRCLTSNPDWYSSINDIFSFASLKMSKLLWSDEGFDFTKSYNIPQHHFFNSLENENHFLQLWQPETEFYSFLKYRLLSISNKEENHNEIIKKYFVLVNYSKFKILWFSNNSFRSIFQALHHPWWTMNDFHGFSKPKIVLLNRHLNFFEKMKYKLSFIIVNYNIMLQRFTYFKYSLKKKLENVK